MKGFDLDTIYQGDAEMVLKAMPEGVVNTCVTSPPYFCLRDYEQEGQVGLEETPALYVERLVRIFRKVGQVGRQK